MASGLVLGLLWVAVLTRVCGVEDLPHGVLLIQFRERVLDGLGLDGPPPTVRVQSLEVLHRRGQRARRATGEDRPTGKEDQDESEIILFPSSGSPCESFTYGFHPSVAVRDAAVTSAHFWFPSSQMTNSSSSLFILAAARRLLAAATPSASDPDGWITFRLDGAALGLVAEGHFLLQVVCASCSCQCYEDQTPFLHLLLIRHRGQARLPRTAAVPWSPSAVDVLQRPSGEERHCQRAAVDISFQELGWDSWIVQPEAVVFHYCHGNCSVQDGAASPLDTVARCCAPVPGTMRSLRVTTTSDGGFSFRHETLPNIMPEECACI
ncbi:inhibin alpha chain [Salarias fasciatus]|uniref:Inhibin alpha chain n=1 Tax=Salarias fasciatus TaxID=181472 RepID=A0A672GDF9_SALFA|nr:inhibin alpha chain [Salarias fasciatus]